MKKITIPARLALALALPLVAAPTFGPAPAPAEDRDEATVRVIASKGSEPIVVNLFDLKEGERKTFTATDGKSVEVTRTASGATLRIDGKETKIRLDGDEPGEGDGVFSRTIVVNDDEEDDGLPGGSKRVVRIQGGGGAKVFVGHGGFGFHTGSPEASAKRVMEKADLDSLRGLDARTRETVEKVLTELAEKGMLLPHAIAWHGEGDGPKVIVERKKTSTK